MKSKNQKNRAFLAAIAMLLVSAIVITTASFAWFTLGKTATVRELDLKVTSKEGIRISANSTVFETSVLTREDLDGTSTNAWKAADGNTNRFPDVISPASSSFGTSTYNQFFIGGIDENAAGRTMKANAATEGSEPLYAFDVYVQYEGEQENITVKVGESQVNVKDDTDGTVANANVEQAMRIGFVNFGTGSNATETVIYAPKDADVTGTNPITGAGESAVLTETEFAVPTSKAGSLSIASSYAANATTDQASVAQLNLAKGVNRVRVYIWMEGQDAMCTDALASQLIGASLVFEMV